jgi:hypothetical protein
MTKTAEPIAPVSWPSSQLNGTGELQRGATRLLAGQGALLHDGRCARSARNALTHDVESCARLGHGGFLPRDPSTNITHFEPPTTRSHRTPAVETHHRAHQS